jgi:hypothetical protein
MSKVHGKNTYISLDDNDLSSHSNTCEWKRMADSHDVTTFGNNSHRKQGGLGDGSSTIGGFYDNTAVTGPRAVIEPLIGSVVEMVHRPEGTGTGLPEDTVNALVQDYTESSPVADMVTWTCALEFDGDVTTGAQA